MAETRVDRATAARRGGIASVVTAPTDNVIAQFLRYAVVGGVAFAVDFGSLYVLTEVIGMYVLVSAAIAFTLGLAANYGMSVAWVFSTRTAANRRLEFVIFALVGVVGIGINESTIWVMAEVMSFRWELAKVVSTVIVFVWNFTLRKLLLFR